MLVIDVAEQAITDGVEVERRLRRLERGAADGEPLDLEYYGLLTSLSVLLTAVTAVCQQIEKREPGPAKEVTHAR